MSFTSIKSLFCLLFSIGLISCSDVKNTKHWKKEKSINDYLNVAKSTLQNNKEKCDSIVYCENFNFKEFEYRNKIINTKNLDDYTILKYFGGKIKNIKVVSKNKFNFSVIVCDCTSYKILIPINQGGFNDNLKHATGFIVAKNNKLLYFSTVGLVIGESPFKTCSYSTAIMFLGDDLYPTGYLRLNCKGNILFLAKVIYEKNTRKYINSEVSFYDGTDGSDKFRSINFGNDTFEYIMKAMHNHHYDFLHVKEHIFVEKVEYPLWFCDACH